MVGKKHYGSNGNKKIFKKDPEKFRIAIPNPQLSENGTHLYAPKLEPYLIHGKNRELEQNRIS